MRASLFSILAVLTVGALLGAPTDPPQTRAVHVTLVPNGEAGAEATGTLTLRALMGPQSPVPLTITPFSKPITFSVPVHTMWETSLALKGWWAAPMAVSVQDHDVDLALTLFPTGSVAGRFVVPEGATLPAGLHVKVDVPPGATKLPGPPSAETPCTVAADATFSCDLPAGVLDLSLHATGYVPLYRWGVKVTKGARVELGKVNLSQGSSVSGFATLVGAKLEAAKGKVALFPETAGASRTAARLGRPIGESPINANGFFQILDVPPGRYVLLASYPAFATATVSPVLVYPRIEAKIKRPIELQQPIALTLRVEPPLDARGKEWSLEVRRASPITNTFTGDPVFRGAAHEGTVTLRSQEGGRYEVVVGDSAGNPFADEQFSTSGAVDESHTFKIDFVRVKGTLHVGDQPLAATVTFGGKFGDKHVALRANEDGVFRGILPHAGPWKVVVTTQSIETELQTDVPKKDDASEEADVDLTISANHVSGTVVDGSGAPVKRASIAFNSGDFGVLRQSDANGQFHFDSVRSGKFTLVAEYGTDSSMQSSAPYTATIGDQDSLDGISLVLKDGHSLHGRVMGRGGPVIGADVTIRPGNGLENAPETNVTSGLDGVFDASLAPDFPTALAVVRAPGYALRVFAVAIDGHAFTLNVPEAGGTIYLDSTPKNATGLFFFQDDRYLSVLDLIHWAKDRGEPFSDGKTFHVSDVAPGRYRACVMMPGGSSATDITRCGEGFLAPYGELHLKID